MTQLSTSDVVQAMNPDIYQRFKQAIELKKWPNGEKLTAQQLSTCIEAIILYEHTHFDPTERTGYIPPKTEPCADESHIHSHEQAIKWQTE